MEAFRQLLDNLIGLSAQQDSSKTNLSHLGTATHTFSHIQQTMTVDHLTLKVHRADATGNLFAYVTIPDPTEEVHAVWLYM